jgi:hypothetical protein
MRGLELCRQVEIPCSISAYVNRHSQVVQAQGTTTETSWLSAGQTGYTSTVPADGTTSGTVVYASPSAQTVTTTITSGGSAYTTTVANGTQSNAGTIEASFLSR